MKIHTENIDFECPCCKDTYSQCPFIAYPKQKIKQQKNKGFSSLSEDTRQSIIFWTFVPSLFLLECLVCYLAARYGI